MWRQLGLGLAGAGLIMVGCVHSQPNIHISRSAPVSQAPDGFVTSPEAIRPSQLPVEPEASASPVASKQQLPSRPVVQFGTPESVSIPSIGIADERVTPVGLTYGSACGSNAPAGCILPAGDRLVWNSTTVMPGQPGIAVIAGHDIASGIKTNFWNLYMVPTGSQITLRVVRNGSASTLTLRVLGKKAEPKTDVQTDPEIQDIHSVHYPRVVFITCNPARGTYRDATGLHAIDNEVVTTEVIAARAS